VTGTLSTRLPSGRRLQTERKTGLPTYEYSCAHCEKNFDVRQSFHDDPLTECPTCGSSVKKVFGNVGIVFKGSGFYKTDSRNGSAAKKDKEPSTAPASSSEGSESGSEKKNESKPAEPAPSASKEKAVASSPKDGSSEKVAKTPTG
jgi:putative FmdB family regulatory protein